MLPPFSPNRLITVPNSNSTNPLPLSTSSSPGILLLPSRKFHEISFHSRLKLEISSRKLTAFSSSFFFLKFSSSSLPFFLNSVRFLCRRRFPGTRGMNEGVEERVQPKRRDQESWLLPLMGNVVILAKRETPF